MTAARADDDGVPVFCCRDWQPKDDVDLRRLMQAQMEADPGWPPDYARSSDLAAWLRRPCTLGGWVAVHRSAAVVGHAGLGTLAEGPVAELLCGALGCQPDDLAEIRRLVVAPGMREHGLASLLTRQAMRTAIEAGRIPVATVLGSRRSWLQMMLDTGWQSVGSTPFERVTGTELHVLAPAERFVELARSYSTRA